MHAIAIQVPVPLENIAPFDELGAPSSGTTFVEVQERMVTSPIGGPH